MERSVVGIIGAGSWGTTVASLLATKSTTTLWARRPELAELMTRTNENPAYLQGVALPRSLVITHLLARAVTGADVVLMAVPSHGFRSVLSDLVPALAPDVPVISLAKGIEVDTNLRMSQIIAELAPGNPAGVLTGPNLAREIAEGQPAASVVALDDAARAGRLQAILHTGTFRVYTGTDVVGCEVAGATKNVMAIAAGICDGLGLGENTRALLITRGLAELARLGVAMGGKPLTFGGLAGIGDLVATCASPNSRNRTVGFELGRGRPLAQIVAGTPMIAEGVNTASPLLALARSHRVEMPIVEQVHAIVEGTQSPRDALAMLLDRPARAEWDEMLLRGRSA